MRRGIGRQVATTVLTAALVIGLTSPAVAADDRSGSRGCGGSTPFGWITASANQSKTMKAPGSGSYDYFASAGTHSTSAAVPGGGYWRGYTGGAFSSLYTSCKAYT